MRSQEISQPIVSLYDWNQRGVYVNLVYEQLDRISSNPSALNIIEYINVKFLP